MTPCRPEGALRAWLDRELPSAESEALATHLKECAACHGLCAELEGRAAHVGALMQSLDAMTQSLDAMTQSLDAMTQSLDMPLPRPARAALAAVPPRPQRWVAVAVTLAAGMALAVYLTPRSHPVQTTVPAVATAAAQAISAQEPPPTLEASAPRRARRTAPKPEEFIALDDEPFESGLIVRVDVPGTDVQADVVFSPDGRARAYRLLQSSSAALEIRTIQNKEKRNE